VQQIQVGMQVFKSVEQTCDARVSCHGQVDNPVERNVKMLLAAYYYALKPRLVVPIALAAATWAGTQAVAVTPEGVELPLLDSLHQVCGGQSWKVVDWPLKEMRDAVSHHPLKRQPCCVTNTHTPEEMGKSLQDALHLWCVWARYS